MFHLRLVIIGVARKTLWCASQWQRVALLRCTRPARLAALVSFTLFTVHLITGVEVGGPSAMVVLNLHAFQPTDSLGGSAGAGDIPDILSGPGDPWQGSVRQAAPQLEQPSPSSFTRGGARGAGWEGYPPSPAGTFSQASQANGATGKVLSMGAPAWGGKGSSDQVTVLSQRAYKGGCARRVTLPSNTAG